MENHFFRQKSIEQVSSPEQLNDYIRVSNPSVWMILTAVIVLLTGVCIWGVFGHLDTTVGCVCISDGSRNVVYIKETDMVSLKTNLVSSENRKASITEGMCVTVGGQEYEIKAIGTEPVSVGGDFSEYAMHIGNLKNGEWVYEATLDAVLPDGVYAAEIVVGSVKPMSFVIN